MPTPEEIEAAAGIAPPGEEERKRIWAAAQVHASAHERGGPGADDLRVAQAMLRAAGDLDDEHLRAGYGRARITLTDSDGEDEVDIAVEFSPQLEEVGSDEVAGTPAQLLALEVLETSFGDEAEPGDLPQ